VTWRRIAAFRALPGVGDLLCAVPALRALRAAYPGARVTLLGLPTSRWFVHRYPDLVDDLLEVEGVAGLPEVVPDEAAARCFRHRARARHFDAILQLHGSGVVTNDLVATLGAGQVVTADPYPTWAHEIDRLLAVAAASGALPVTRELDLPMTAAERRVAAQLARRAHRGRAPLVCLQPGASRPSRRWSATAFAAVADHVAAHGCAVALTGSPGDHHQAQVVLDAMDAEACDLVGQTGLGELAALFAGAQLVVSNDSGAAHVAAAVRAPSVMASGSDEPWRWAPLDHARHLTVTGPAGGWPSLDDVVAAVDRQLER